MDKVSIDDFGKLDFRVGEIKEVDDHPNADKLFVMKVDLGEGEVRNIVAGLRGHYSVDELKGKKAIFVANLQPVKLRGVESNGMILAASNKERTKVKILMVDGDLETGSKIS
jgi:methionyl-tRNA synthetase